MKPVIMYEARDGSRWKLEEEAVSRDALVDECHATEQIIGPRPTDTKHGEFVQHDRAKGEAFHIAMVRLARKHTAWWDGWAKWDAKGPWKETDVHPGSIVGRIIDDSDLTPLNRLWYRFNCMDQFYREWDQPYFANKAREAVPA